MCSGSCQCAGVFSPSIITVPCRTLGPPSPFYLSYKRRPFTISFLCAKQATFQIRVMEDTYLSIYLVSSLDLFHCLFIRYIWYVDFLSLGDPTLFLSQRMACLIYLTIYWVRFPTHTRKAVQTYRALVTETFCWCTRVKHSLSASAGALWCCFL